MAFTHDFQVGDVVDAKVVEVLDAATILISLTGTLARAANETTRKLAPGDMVKLRVASTTPLQLRVVANERKFGRLDIVT